MYGIRHTLYGSNPKFIIPYFVNGFRGDKGKSKQNKKGVPYTTEDGKLKVDGGRGQCKENCENNNE